MIKNAMKILLKKQNQMFCKFHFFPIVKFSHVLVFTKLTLVTKKKKK